MKLSEVIKKEIEKTEAYQSACRRLGSEYLQKAKEQDELADSYLKELEQMVRVLKFAEQLEKGEEPINQVKAEFVITTEQADLIKSGIDTSAKIGMRLDFAGDGPVPEEIDDTEDKLKSILKDEGVEIQGSSDKNDGTYWEEELKKKAEKWLDKTIKSRRTETSQFQQEDKKHPFNSPTPFVPHKDEAVQVPIFQPDSLFEMPTKWSEIEVMQYNELEYIWQMSTASSKKVFNAIMNRELHMLTYVRIETAKMLNIVVPNHLLLNGND